MGHARHIGRVGALAVALGVGMAASTGYGPVPVSAASEDTSANGGSGGSGSSGSAHSGSEPDDRDSDSGSEPDDRDSDSDSEPDDENSDSDSDATGPTTTDVVNDEAADPQPDPDQHNEAESDPASSTNQPLDVPNLPPSVSTDTPESSATESSESTESRAPSGGTDIGRGEQASPKVDDATNSPPLSSSRPTEPADDAARTAANARQAIAPAVTSVTASEVAVEEELALVETPITVRPVALPRPTLAEALAALPASLASAATGLVALALSPLFIPSLFGVPGGSTDSPLLWTVLAFARRQLFNTAPTLAPGPAVTDTSSGLIFGTLSPNDADGDSVTVSVLRGPANGSVGVIPSSGTYVYQPNAGYTGQDSFVIAVTDSGPDGLFGFLQPGRGHVTAVEITVTAAAPPAPDFVIDGVDSETGTVTGRLDVDGTPTLTVSSAPTRGTVVVDPDGRFAYTPAPLERAYARYRPVDDSFTVTVTGPTGPPSTITVTTAVDSSTAALAYRVPAGDTRLDIDAPVIDPITGRVYRLQGVRGSGVNVLVATEPDGTVLQSESILAGGRADLAVNPRTGAAYLTLAVTDPDSGAAATEILVITAAGDSATISAPGTAIGFVVFDSSGAGYQTVSGDGVTSVIRFDADGTLLDVDTLDGAAVGSVTVHPTNGRAFQTTQVGSGSEATTTVTLLSKDGVIVTNAGIDGQGTAQVVINPVTGRAYQVSSVLRAGFPPTVTPVITALDEDGTITDTVRFPGLGAGSLSFVNPVTGATYVQVTDRFRTTSIVVIDADEMEPGWIDAEVTDPIPGVFGVIDVNPRTGTAYVRTTTLFDDNGGFLTVISPGGAVASPVSLPGTGVSRVRINPVGDLAIVTSSGGNAVSVVDSSGAVRTIPGSLVGDVLTVDPVSGTTYLTTRVGDDAVLTIVDADGATVASVPLAGVPSGAAVRDAVTGTVYQTTEAADALTSSTVYAISADGSQIVATELVGGSLDGAVINSLDGTVYEYSSTQDGTATLNVITRDGTVYRHALPGSVSPLDFGGNTRASIVPNTVVGGAYLLVLVDNGGSGSLIDRLEQRLVAVSAEGSAITVYGRDTGFRGFAEFDPQVNPATGVAYVSTNVPIDVERNNGLLVYSFSPDGTSTVTDPLPAISAFNGVTIDTATGTVYHGTDRGTWIVDVDPELAT